MLHRCRKRVEVELIDDNQEILLSNKYHGVRAVYIADLETRDESSVMEPT